jgi:2-polyprenyl-3-methyl-5-hydroxy-6-metoxy-1,4-benzoquinol methylase
VRAKVFHRSTCRLCDGADVERVVDIAPIPLAEKYLTAEQIHEPPELYPVDLYQCRTCGHVQIMDVIDPATLWQDFTYRSGQTQGIVDHLEMVAQQVVERRKPPPGSLVVDIGSNDGTFLNAFRKRGFKVLGVDPAKEIAREASARGIETLAELVTPELAAKIRTERGPANVVTVFNTFAHADDMAGMAESIRCLLAPDGVFLFEVQYLLDIIDHVLLGTIIHEHLCHHSLKPLASFLLRHGIEVIDVERNTIQMGSLIGTAQLQGGPRPVSDTFE